MRCQLTSKTTHKVLISKEISYKSYNEICSVEPQKVNLGYLGKRYDFDVKNNSLVQTPRDLVNYIHGKYSYMALNWDILSKFFSIHNIEPKWLHCHYIYGHYDDKLGGWTGCVGQV